jgi:tetratricopeptide (TPR) repeat protein
MQRLKVKFILICTIFFACGLCVHAQASDGDAATSLESGNKAFEAGQFTQAMALYEKVYAQGKFSEMMLYRLAFMHENLRAYPQAIYYLKKAAQEYGEHDTDAKIRQLMQRQGSTRFFSGDPWNAYLTLSRAWGWIVYLAFGLAIAALVAHYLLPNVRKPSWRQLGMVGAWGLLLAAAFMLFHRNFMVPQRAVLLEQTAFYSEPGFSANHHLGAFSLGETLDIDDHSDIWIQISAGGQQWWVPNWVVRTL